MLVHLCSVPVVGAAGWRGADVDVATKSNDVVRPTNVLAWAGTHIPTGPSSGWD